MMIATAGHVCQRFPALFMTDELGATNAQAAIMMSIMFIPGLVGGTILGGWISDRIGTVRIVIATSIISGLVIFGIREATGLNLFFYIILFIMGLNMAIRMPVTEVFIMSQTPAKNRSTIYGAYYFTMQYTGAVFAPIMGGLIERYSFHTMFLFSSLSSIS
jgi:MFS family permease